MTQLEFWSNREIEENNENQEDNRFQIKREGLMANCILRHYKDIKSKDCWYISTEKLREEDIKLIVSAIYVLKNHDFTLDKIMKGIRWNSIKYNLCIKYNFYIK